ncbi:helix-turn-helix domain-containing protein [Streptomyces sp. R302]|nr:MULTISPECIES: helix-turn-helix domain-containing protein [unclassified Streptomyces]NML53165.1 helix-turn-helix domain-containing protein [Streptomyces sp. R301]NML82848.1 helix-turn-helix domain-containing protein [Streptomyces sp. R302]
MAESESTRISNRLLQDPRLSFLARGLGGFIQSLPAGTNISIRTLTAAAAEGEVRVAAALRELEAAGYLERRRLRLPGGCLVTRTVSRNTARASDDEDPDPDLDPDRTPVPDPEPAREAPPQLPAEPPVPDDRATRLLCSLSRVDPRLTLSARDVVRLTPGVRKWFARGLDDEEITGELTARLPTPLTHPAGLLAHRLTNLVPPARFLPPPPDPQPAAPRWGIKFHHVPAFMSCDNCDRTFRSSTPGLCERCEASGVAPTAA